VRRYRLSREAFEDLREIRDYLREEASATLANRMLDELSAGFRFLNRNPGVGHTRHDLTSLPVKFWRVHSYSVVYSPEKGGIEIVRVLHGSRDVASILER
jgi:plasmid stabilization system protein ParE